MSTFGINPAFDAVLDPHDGVSESELLLEELSEATYRFRKAAQRVGLAESELSELQRSLLRQGFGPSKKVKLSTQYNRAKRQRKKRR